MCLFQALFFRLVKIAKNLQQVEKIERKIGKSKDIEEKVELLSMQFGELCHMIAVLVSMQLH